MPIKKYPASFPAPMVEGYGINVDMGVISTQMSSGVRRIRRRHRSMPMVFSFNFAVKVLELDSWQTWVDSNAYTWFEIPATSFLTGMVQNDKHCSPHIVRFISDLSMSPINANAFTVQVAAELAPTSKYSRPGIFTDDWIIAGDPANPSANVPTANTYTGSWVRASTGAPVNAATDWINSGSPAFPAAVI